MTGSFVSDENSITDFSGEQSFAACSTAFLFVHTGSTFCTAVVSFHFSLFQKDWFPPHK